MGIRETPTNNTIGEFRPNCRPNCRPAYDGLLSPEAGKILMNWMNRLWAKILRENKEADEEYNEHTLSEAVPDGHYKIYNNDDLPLSSNFMCPWLE